MLPFGKNAFFIFVHVWILKNCVAASGALRFSVRGFVWDYTFFIKEDYPMKKVRIVSCVLLCLIISMIIVGCGATYENVVGTWRGSHVYEGNEFDKTLIVNSNGDYEYTVYKNGSFSESESGRWTIESGALILHPSGADYETKFTLSGNTLKNGDYVRLQKVGS